MNMIQNINDILQNFSPISLDEMKNIRLMNRMDTKYVVNIHTLLDILQYAIQNYRVQQVDDERNIAYHTIYFDTDDQTMYITHQNGRKTREKIRVRSYVSSGLTFLEIKNKNNKGRTDKKRIKLLQMTDSLPDSEEIDKFLAKHALFTRTQLSAQIENHFNRITLVNNSMTERLTIDTGLQFHNLCNDHQIGLDNIAIIELKRDGRTPSPMYDLLIKLHVHPMGFSKYCMGYALTNASLKQNLFKQRIHQVLKLNEAVYD